MQDQDQSQSEGGADSVTDYTTTSWWDRIKQSIAGMGAGLVLLAGSCWGIFWNEGRAVQTARALSEGAGAVISVESARRDPANDGKLIHISGEAKSSQPLSDAEFGVAARGLRLVRHAEMYQWKEEKRSESRSKLGGGQETVTTYEYRRTWSKDEISSSGFREPRGHQNPPMRFKGRSVNAENVSLGGYKPGEEVLSRLGSGKEFPAPQESLQALRARHGPSAQIIDGKIIIGNAADPRIGDVKISYTLVPEGPVSLAARQQGESLTAYRAANGRSILLAQTGVHSAAELFDDAKQENKIITWLLRGAGALAMFIGWSLLMRPVVVLADVVPLFGSIAGFGAGLAAGLLTLVLAPLVMAVAWFYHRPLISLAIAAAGLAAAFGLKQWRGQRAAPPRLQPAAQGASFMPAQGQGAPPPASFIPAQGASFLPPQKQ